MSSRSQFFCMACVAMAIAMVGLSPVVEAALIIDRFADATPQVVPSPPPLVGLPGTTTTDSRTGLNNADTIGTVRDIKLEITGPPGNVGAAFVSVGLGGVSVLASSTSLNAEVAVTIQWDATSGFTTPPDYTPGLNGVDVTQGGINTDFHIRGRSDLGYSLTMKVYETTTGTTSSLTKVLPAGNVTTDVFFPFASFANSAFFNNVGAIELVMVTSLIDADASLIFVQAVGVPEPGSLAIWGLLGGAVALVQVRRKRRRSA